MILRPARAHDRLARARNEKRQRASMQKVGAHRLSPLRGGGLPASGGGAGERRLHDTVCRLFDADPQIDGHSSKTADIGLIGSRKTRQANENMGSNNNLCDAAAIARYALRPRYSNLIGSMATEIGIENKFPM